MLSSVTRVSVDMLNCTLTLRINHVIILGVWVGESVRFIIYTIKVTVKLSVVDEVKCIDGFKCTGVYKTPCDWACVRTSGNTVDS